MSQNIPNSGLSARVCLKNHATRLPARTLISISIAGVLSTWTAHTHAQESFAPDAVVSAARTTQAVTDALPSTTVITRADIESATVSDVVSLLRQQVGVSVRQSGTRGALSGISIRGGEPKHTLILIDGVPLNNLSAGTTPLEQVPLALIDRIEIVRGNVSALYGSQATGGLVQIFTRKTLMGNQADVRVAIGDKRQKQASTQLSMGNDKVQLTAGVAHEEVRAVSAQNAPYANPDKDGYRNNSGNIQFKFTPNERNEFGVRFYESRGRNEYDSEFGTHDLKVNKTREQQMAIFANNQISERWSSALQLSQLTDVSDDYTQSSSVNNQEHFETKTQNISWQNQFNLDHATAIVGLSLMRQKLNSTSDYTEHQRTTKSAWLGYVLDKNQHHLQLNARYDDLSNVGQYTTGAVNYGYDITPKWRVFGGYSNGFLAPSFNDLFMRMRDSGSYQYYDNQNNLHTAYWAYNYSGAPNLKPEQSIYSQVGIQFSDNDRGARLTYFDTRYRNKITYQETNTYPSVDEQVTDGSMVNVDKARTKGVEWHGWFNRNGWHFDTGLTYQEVRNRATNEILIRQPRVLANIGVGKVWGKWQTQVDWQAQSKMKDGFLGSLNVTGFGVLNTSVSYQARKDLKIGVTVGNVFNRRYEPLAKYNSMPRNFLFSVNYKPSW